MLIGCIADRIDKFTLYTFASAWMMIVFVIYTNMSVTLLWLVMIVNVWMMMGILSRMVPAVALTTAIPDLAGRGAFMRGSFVLARTDIQLSYFYIYFYANVFD